MQNKDLPITDWTQTGRQQYVETNRLLIQLVIEQALEDFDAQSTSLIFQSQEKAVKIIINLFGGTYFNVDYLPNGIPKDITLFSQLPFWSNLKTAGKVSSGDRTHNQVQMDDVQEPIEPEVSKADLYLQKLAKIINKYNQQVAPDLVGYWLQANKKLLRELTLPQSALAAAKVENEVSAPQKTRYKVDASFRYLYLFLNIAEHLDTVELYQNKYFVKGLNRPQYVAGHSETHRTKLQVRQTIKLIINRFHDIFVEIDDQDFLLRALFKAIAKTAVLDVYEINRNDPCYSDYAQKLKQLKAKPSTLLEHVS
jgi:hypothetical protein